MILRSSSSIVLVILAIVYVGTIESQISGAEHLCDLTTVCGKDLFKKNSKISQYFVYKIRIN